MSKQYNKAHTDSRGSLYPINFNELPFIPRHMFYTTGVPVGENRGGHAHYQSEQVLVCIQGLIMVTLYDGDNQEIVTLLPNQSVHLPNMIWSTQYFVQEDSILLVLASQPYDEEDYIRDINIFKQLVMERNNE